MGYCFRLVCKMAVGTIAILALSSCTLITTENLVPYPSSLDYGPEICYSPNHEYYVRRYQTHAQSLKDQLFAEGMVELYDKSGKLLYKGKSLLSEDAGPFWTTDSVFYIGNYEWGTDLPTSPGEHPTSFRGCFNEISHYVSPKPEPISHRDVIIKAVKPLDTALTNSPYQLQFLVVDQDGEPFARFFYMIIRTDGSRQRGETDEQGRTFIINSSAHEKVTFYFSPRQNAESFMMPEELQRCSEKKNRVCLNVGDYMYYGSTFNIKASKKNER